MISLAKSALCRGLIPCVIAGVAALGPWAQGAAAQTVTVRGGEHPGFSRLVLDFGRVPYRRETSGEMRHRIEFGGPPRHIDASGAFQRLGRARIRDVQTELNRIDIAIGCPCVVQSYELPGGRLVIDVVDRDRGITAGAAAGMAMSQVMAEAASQEVVGAVVANGPFVPEPGEVAEADHAPVANTALPTRDSGQVVAPRRGASEASALGAPVGFWNEAGPSRPNSAEPNDKGDGTSAAAAGQSVHRSGAGTYDWTVLADQAWDGRVLEGAASAAIRMTLDRAVEQGLVDRPERLDARRAIEEGELDAPGSETRPGPSLRVTTSTDRDLAALAERLEPVQGDTCLDGQNLDVSGWAAGVGAMARLGRLRRDLLGEFDEAASENVEALARHYIFLSFGAEARAVLAAYPVISDERDTLFLLADVADGVTRHDDGRLARLLECPGPAALWALLAIDAPPREADVVTAEVVAAFSALPLHLRRYYGPRLVESFLDLEDPETARSIWAAVDRASGDHGDRFALAGGDIAMATGDIKTAEAAYAALGSAGPSEAPLAVVRLIQSRLARSLPVDPGLVETAAALSFENRGTPLARELKRAELLGRISLDQWDKVMDDLPRARFSGALAAEDENEIAGAFYIALTERAAASGFLVHATAAKGRLDPGEAADAPRRALARRFLALGLGGEAIGLLDGMAAPLPEDIHLRAEAGIVLGDYEVSLAELASLSTPAAEALRGRALQGLGRHDEARAAFERAGDTNAARVAAARGGEFATAGGLLRDAALSLSDGTLAPEVEGETELAEKRNLVTSAAALRAGIEALMAAAEPDAAGP